MNKINADKLKSFEIAYLDLIQFESNLPAKCGEVFITKEGEVSFKCLLCTEIWNSIDEFLQHVIDGHVKLRTKINEKLTDADINLDVDFKYLSDNDSENLNKSSIKLELLTSDNGYIEEQYENSEKNSLIDSVIETNHESYTCDMCEFSFTDKKYFLNHYNKTHEKFGKEKKVKIIESNWNTIENKIFKCDECPKIFRRKINLHKHKLSKHTEGFNYVQPSNNKPFKCLTCEASFYSQRRLKEHSIKHTSERPHQCSSKECGKSFKTNCDRKYHERIHTGEKPFLCPTCGESFAYQHKLKLHKRRVHMSYSSRPHKCAYKGCTRAFLFPRQLREHLNTHTGCKPHVCDQCNSRFAKISSLQEHKKIHSGIKKHICLICGKAFTQVAGLATHRKTHNLEPSMSLKDNLKAKYKLIDELDESESGDKNILIKEEDN